MNEKKHFKTKLVLKHLLFILIIVFLCCFGCPVYRFFSITCPVCGTTRAWLSFLSGNFREAFEHHLFFPLIPLFVFLAAHLKCSFIRKHYNLILIFLIAFAVVLFVYNLLRINGTFC